MNSAKLINNPPAIGSRERITDIIPFKENRLLPAGQDILSHQKTFKTTKAITKDNSRLLRLQLYKKVLWQMLNNPAYILNGHFDRGLTSFIGMCSEDSIRLKNLPELYVKRPWHLVIHPKCRWWKLDSAKAAQKGIKVLQEAIVSLQAR